MKTFSKIILWISLTAWVATACQDSQPVAGEAESIAGGFQFTEGPFWHPDGFLIFSDIPANTIYKWTPGTDSAEIFLQPSDNSNGITRAGNGTLILAQHAGKVSQLTPEMDMYTIVDSYEGKRLNSPNDVAVRSDGLIYFTDPPFGVSDEDQELEFSGVYKIREDGNLTLLYDQFTHPNGIAFSPEETHLYVNDSRTGQIIRFDVTENGELENPIRFANIGAMTDMGGADGMKTDSRGRLYTTGPNGLIIFDSNGTQIYQQRFDHQITNLTFGGEEGNELFITSPNDVYRIPMNATGW